jgi:hypothetical protein
MAHGNPEESCGGERWDLADVGEGDQRRTGQRIRYPCQTCLPQAHQTVSVGFCLVSCCLQTGQGLVITYVIAVTSQAKGLFRSVHVAYQKT